jgi:acyl transferase domain-containing protein
MLSQDSSSAVMHLRRFNPMLASMLQTHAAGGSLPPYVARQDGPGLLNSAAGSEWQATSGISAFAFQGTNAHAILVKGSGLPGSRQSQDSQWQRRRFWFAAPPHPLASRLAASRPAVQLQAVLHGAALAYLWDHRVQNRALLPGAAMFETAYAAGMLLLAGSSGTGSGAAAAAALAGVSIPAPLVLPEGSASSVTMTTAVEAATGRVTLHSKSGSGRPTVHLAGGFGRCKAGLVPAATPSSPHQTGAHLMALSWLASSAVLAAEGSQQPPMATASLWLSVRYQADQYHMHPAVTDNATQVTVAEWLL